MSRYWITGVQLGLLQALPQKERNDLARKIFDEQWIENVKGLNSKVKF